MTKDETPMNKRTFAKLINVSFKNKNVSLALKAFKDMQGSGHQPEVVVYKTLIDGFSKNGDVETAIKTLIGGCEINKKLKES
eukprot:Awhi_evm1s11130